MAQSAGFHEDPADLAPATKDRHRALASIQEELEAIDWYDQRVGANLRTYLFSTAPVAQVEAAAMADGTPGAGEGSLRIGGLRGVEQ